VRSQRVLQKLGMQYEREVVRDGSALALFRMHDDAPSFG
jgi:hypothetical protein